MEKVSGWVSDVYAHPERGVTFWMLCDDGTRRSFRQDFATAFHVRGPAPRLKELWSFLLPKGVQLERVKGTDLYDGERDDILEARFDAPDSLMKVFWEAQQAFPDLTYYDVDTALYLRYWAAFDIFPFARCRLSVKANHIQKIERLDSRWDVDPDPPSLRKMFIKPDVDPSRSKPKFLRVQYEGFDYKVPLNKPRDLLFLLNSILLKYNPDVIITQYGDTWLFDYLARLSAQTGIPFRPNRDYFSGVVNKDETKYRAYGQAHFRGKQIHLLGRIHIDMMNCSNYEKRHMAGVMEMARITGLPVQEAARRSAGAGISAMQVLTALRWGVMVPYQKQKGEAWKTWRQLFKLDRGGLIALPPPGVHKNVFIIDFLMMYPVLMVLFNLSPETVGVNDKDALELLDTGLKVARRRGLVPETLDPMVEKRRSFKRKLKSLTKDHSAYANYKDRSDTIKDLGVVSNGRMGFANAIFGRLQAYEAIAYLGRHILLKAKEIAEAYGFTVLHMYVDSLFLSREGAYTEADIQPVLDDLDGIYPWVAFNASRQNPKVQVANRYFALDSEGGFKVRGLKLRRHDTCTFVAGLQQDAMNLLGLEKDPARLAYRVADVIKLVRERCAMLQSGNVPLDQLVITRKLSRDLNEYKASSAMFRAAKQLQAAGRVMGMGRIVRYLLTLCAGGSYPWGLADELRPNMIDVRKYKELIILATYELLQPIGVSEKVLRGWLSGATYVLPEDWPHMGNMEQPLFASIKAPVLPGIDVTGEWPGSRIAENHGAADVGDRGVTPLEEGGAMNAYREGADPESEFYEETEPNLISSPPPSQRSEYYAPVPDVA